MPLVEDDYDLKGGCFGVSYRGARVLEESYRLKVYALGKLCSMRWISRCALIAPEAIILGYIIITV